MCRDPRLLDELANYVGAIVLAEGRTRVRCDTPVSHDSDFHRETKKKASRRRLRSRKELARCYLNGRTALHEAARTKNASGIRLLLTAARALYGVDHAEYKAFVNRPDKYACTALHYSVLLPFRGWDHSETGACVDMLIRSGADPLAKQPLSLMQECNGRCGWGSTPLTKLLERAGENVWSPRRGSPTTSIRERMCAVADRAALAIVVAARESGHPVEADALWILYELDWPRTTWNIWNNLPNTDTSMRHRVLNSLLQSSSYMSILYILRHDPTALTRHKTKWYRSFIRSKPSLRQSRLALSIFANLPILRPWAVDTHREYPSDFRGSFRACALVLERRMPGHNTGWLVRMVGSYVQADFFTRGVGFPYVTIKRAAGRSLPYGR